VGAVLAEGDVVIYESTVYPGATEEVCGPDARGGLRPALPEHFHSGYSPERINPGDRSTADRHR
jgi:UDP-N-acetyl-D-galactosamine dehydrogenase